MSDFRELRRKLLSRLVNGEVTPDDYFTILEEIGQAERKEILDQENALSTQPFDSTAKGTLRPGIQLGPYCVQNMLGKGGMGEVWLAWEEVGGFYVVIKCLPRHLQEKELRDVLAVFHRVRLLQHQCICPVYTLGKDRSLGYYFVMKYVEGYSLNYFFDDWHANESQHKEEQFVSILERVASALDYAHSRKVIHRDVKPRNIMVSDNLDDVQVVDFGLAARIQGTLDLPKSKEQISGTPAYMAPEQWEGTHQDGRTDQYGLACVAYEGVSHGQLPFGREPKTIWPQIVQDEPKVVHTVNQNVNDVLSKGLAKRQADRFDSCVEFIDALKVALRQQ